MIKLRYCLLAPMLLLQVACVGYSTMGQRPPFKSLPEPQEPVARPGPRPSSPTQAQRPPEISQPEDRVAGGAQVTAPPAVVALQNEAQTSLESGDLDNAAVSLERAIRIQPRNPELWHDLAKVRLRQQQPGLAEDLAKKSNLHAKGNNALIRANWAIIAESRRLKGDTEGAVDAQERAGN